MDATTDGRTMTKETVVERPTDRELVVTRTVHGSPQTVFAAWTEPELFKRWWVPASVPIRLLACEMDVRVGGRYRLVFESGPSSTMEFFGRYLAVVPGARLSWTNDEGDDEQVTTVTFEARGDGTLVTVVDRYASKAALDAAIDSGSTGAFPEQLAQLDELLAGIGSDPG
jgi:uncharacterized protein YndB with AHSA1/START domain